MTEDGNERRLYRNKIVILLIKKGLMDYCSLSYGVAAIGRVGDSIAKLSR